MRHLLLLIIFIQSTLCLGFQQANISAFVYHRFGDDRYPSTNIDLDKFEAQLKFLKNNGYSVVTLSEAMSSLNSQSTEAKVAVISIDDAYKSFYANGWPLLKKYDFPATLFVNTETVGAGDFMGWQEIREVKEAGIEIGNHSHAHPYFLNDYNKQDFLEDLYVSQNEFEEHLREIPTSYAYPYGECNSSMREVLDSLGFSNAVAQKSGVIYSGSSLFSLPRFPMSNDYADMEQFKEKLSVAALEINNITTYQEGIMGSETSPTIVISFYEKDLELKYLQVFIQGTEVNKSITVGKDGLVKLTISPKSSLKKRRTLFTVTVPNKRGEWAWYSYSLVITKVR
jgi:peptidoglycan/xylan/chitin deacetylase (PgdA/CDA1 family)